MMINILFKTTIYDLNDKIYKSVLGIKPGDIKYKIKINRGLKVMK